MILAPRTRHRIRKAVLAVVAVEFAWLVLINTALQLPLTQSLVNKIRPEKFHVSWESAWSWYPGQVRADGIFANGQSRSQQWQFETSSVKGRISVLPLLWKRVGINGAVATDLEFRMRPRLKADRDYTREKPYFPEIDGWDYTPAVTAPRKKKRPWQVSVNDARVEGIFDYWIYQFSGEATGVLTADLEYQSNGGPLTLDGKHLELDLGSAFVNGTEEVFRDGKLKGSLGFDPFVPREHKDISLLNYLLLDIDLAFDVNSLRFVNLFTLNFPDLKVGGRGKVGGQLNFERGWVLEGTDLVIEADDLTVDTLSYRIEGDGNVFLQLGPETDGLLDLGVAFHDLHAYQPEQSAPFLAGEGLKLQFGGNGLLVPDPEKPNESRVISLAIDGLLVPDLSLLQRYLPDKWPFQLHGGTGNLEGEANLSSNSLAIDLKLESEAAEMGIRQYRFDTNLESAIRLVNPDITAGGTNIAGSYIRLTDAHLLKEGEKSPEPWHASLEITDGQFSLFTDDQREESGRVLDLLELLGRSETRQILARSTGMIGFESRVSSLAWIGVLFGAEQPISVTGRGELTGKLFIASGWPQAGTNVEILSDDLSVEILDYQSGGDGRIRLELKEGGDYPDWLVQVVVSDGSLKRSQKSEGSIQDVTIMLDAVIEDVSFNEEAKKFTLEFRIPSARVTDMTIFNNMLPPDAPLRLVGGTADLTADILLHRDEAQGWVKLRSRELEAWIDEQSIKGDLEVDVLLTGGVPAEMMFDISGSELRLGNVQVVGTEREFDQEYWSAALNLTRGETTWTDPPRVEADAELLMSDSRPFVAMFVNQEGWRPDFLANIITVEDISGTASMSMEDDRILIPQANVRSDNIEVRAKASITEKNRKGVVYISYKSLDALIKINAGKRNLDLFRVRDKFEAYQVEP